MEAKSEDYCGQLLLYILQPHEFLQDRKNNQDYGSYSHTSLLLSQVVWYLEDAVGWGLFT